MKQRLLNQILSLLGVGCFTVLLQPSLSHAETPAPAAATQPTVAIHWVNWTDDLFQRATNEHKLVILDLQAVWCHWCHVMDDITYSDPKVIDLMTSKYICVRVDQDSRPDLSNRYEKYGWPATIVFNSSGAELAKRSGYIPPKPMASMLQAFIDDPTPGPSIEPEKAVVYAQSSALGEAFRDKLWKDHDSAYDSKEGGWGVIHKYVDSDAVELCMGASDDQHQQQARQTLTAGIKLIDSVWGGVNQYSTDGDWVHPHFEKLLAFQAALLRTYSRAAVRWNDPAYLGAASNLHRYMHDFLRDPEGAFYVSQDADLVPGQHSGEYYALDDAGRRKLGVPRVDKHLYSRENGWAISGLVAYSDATGDASVLDEAVAAARWVIARRQIDYGGFRHDEGDPAGPYLADSLFMAQAFLDLYSATADREWLKQATTTARFIETHFRAADDKPGFLTSVPTSQGTAGWQPTPQIDENVAAARLFNLLGHYTGDAKCKPAAEFAMRYLATPQIAESRLIGFAGILVADRELGGDPLHVTVLGQKDDPAAQALFTAARKTWTNYRRLEWMDEREGPLPHPDVEYPKMKNVAFVCTGNTCSSPIRAIAALSAKENGG